MRGTYPIDFDVDTVALVKQGIDLVSGVPGAAGIVRRWFCAIG
jgi:hypothetical protein